MKTDLSKTEKNYRSLIVPVAVLLCAGTLFAQTVYEGTASGMVIMEAEKTASSLDKWVKVTAPANYAGTGGLEFTGNTENGGNPLSPLVYKFKINAAGIYKIKLRAHKRLAGAAADKCNDCYIKVEGDYTSGSNLPLSGLTAYNKCYIHGSSATTWDYSGLMDGLGWDHTQALYNFKAGQTYTMTVAGRSIRYTLDRIVFHLPAAEATALNYLTPETLGTGTIHRETGRYLVPVKGQTAEVYSLTGQYFGRFPVGASGKVLTEGKIGAGTCIAILPGNISRRELVTQH